jgi:hypothetical protein
VVSPLQQTYRPSWSTVSALLPTVSDPPPTFYQPNPPFTPFIPVPILTTRVSPRWQVYTVRTSQTGGHPPSGLVQAPRRLASRAPHLQPQAVMDSSRPSRAEITTFLWGSGAESGLPRFVLARTGQDIPSSGLRIASLCTYWWHLISSFHGTYHRKPINVCFKAMSCLIFVHILIDSDCPRDTVILQTIQQ